MHCTKQRYLLASVTGLVTQQIYLTLSPDRIETGFLQTLGTVQLPGLNKGVSISDTFFRKLSPGRR